jgi:signal transduction histidine kinase
MRKMDFQRPFLHLIFIFCALFGVPSALSAQTEGIDSLMLVLEKNTDAKQGALLKLELSNLLLNEQKPGAALQYARESLSFFTKEPADSINLATAILQLSYVLGDLGRNQAGADTANIAAAIFDRKKIWFQKAAALMNVGKCYMLLQQYDLSGKYYEQALQYHQELRTHNPEALITLLTNRGSLAKMQNNPDLALARYLEAEKTCRMLNIEYPFLYSRMKLVYEERGEFSETLYWAKKAVEVSRKKHDDFRLSQNLSILGELYTKLNDINGTIQVLKEAIETAERAGNKYVLIEARLNLAELYARQNDLDSTQLLLLMVEKNVKASTLNHIPKFSYIKGFVFQIHETIDSSIYWLNKAISSARDNDFQIDLCNALSAQGDNFLIQKNYHQALKLFKEGISYAQKNDYKTEEMAIWSKMANAYEKIGNFKLALQAQRSADTLAESILQKREKTYYDLAYLNLQTRTEKNTLEQQNQLYAKEQESLRLKVGWLTTGLIALLLCTGIYFFYRQLQNQRKYATVLKKESDQKIDTLKTINAALSHDLKNPALKAKYYLSQLKEKLQPAQYQLIKPDYALIESNIDHFYLLINKLRSLYNFENTEVSATTFEADSVVADIKQELSPLIEKTNAQITQDALPAIETDKLLFRQMMMNLLHNAVKFASIGQQPLIHIGYENRDGKHIFKVRDNGIGVPKEEQENIFKLFRSAHQREQVEGDGIGLAISKRIVEKLGGNIWVDSVPNGGTQFMVAIPTT